MSDENNINNNQTPEKANKEESNETQNKTVSN